jgi:hypothetical protein
MTAGPAARCSARPRATRGAARPDLTQRRKEAAKAAKVTSINEGASAPHRDLERRSTIDERDAEGAEGHAEDAEVASVDEACPLPIASSGASLARGVRSQAAKVPSDGAGASAPRREPGASCTIG